MVAATELTFTERIAIEASERRVQYATDLKPHEDSSIWETINGKKARVYVAHFFQQPDTISGIVLAAGTNYPHTLEGHLAFFARIDELIEDRRANNKLTGEALATLDTTTVRQRLTWLVWLKHGKYTLHATNQSDHNGKYIVDLPEVIEQLGKFVDLSKLLDNGKGVEVKLLVHWSYAPDVSNQTIKRVSKIELPVMSEDDRDVIAELISIYGSEKQVKIADNHCDAETLERLADTGWLIRYYRRPDLTPFYAITREAAVKVDDTMSTEKVKEPMADLPAKKTDTPAQKPLIADKKKPWHEDADRWKYFCENTSSVLAGELITVDDIEAVILMICAVVDRKDITITENEFYTRRDEWIKKEKAHPVDATPDDDDPTLPGLVPGATNPSVTDTMPEPGEPKFPVATLSEVGRYFGKVNECLTDHGLPDMPENVKQRDYYHRQAQGGKSATELPASKEQECLANLKALLNDECPIAESWLDWAKAHNATNEEMKAASGVENLRNYTGKLQDVTKRLYEIRSQSQSAPESSQKADNSNMATNTSVPQSTAKSERSNGASSTAKDNPFKKAKKEQSKLRLMLAGVAGGGKTYTALDIARNLYPSGKIALIDTERGSAAKYADLFDFDVLELAGDYSPERYIERIRLAEQFNYDVLIIDSSSHEWEGENGILEQVDDVKARLKNPNDTRTAWKEMTPRHRAFITAIQTANLHVIVTARAEEREVIERNPHTKEVTSRKMAFAIKQRPGITFEFDIVAKLDGNQTLNIDKSRCPSLTGFSGNRPGRQVADSIREWLGIAAA